MVMPASFRPTRRPSLPIACLVVLLVLLAGCAFMHPPKQTLGQRQVQTLTELNFKKTDDGWLLALPDHLLFDFNKDELKPQLRKTIANFAHRLLDVDIRQLRVEGHTDNVGVHGYNTELSQRRASVVASTFVANGFTAEDIVYEGLGPDHPAADNATPEGRAQNRRVEIIVEAHSLAP
jgi:outer membrane protein OmpA-like peptidoglycan-associated protein